MPKEVCDIITLAGRFKSHSELQEYSNKQFIALDKAAKQIKQLEDEVEHLKQLLATTTTLLDSPVERIIITPEQAICDAQIELIQKRAIDGKTELTLEEIKKLDLLIKNKRLAKEQATTIDGKAKTITLPNSQLLQIASQMDKPQNEG